MDKALKPQVIKFERISIRTIQIVGNKFLIDFTPNYGVDTLAIVDEIEFEYLLARNHKVGNEAIRLLNAMKGCEGSPDRILNLVEHFGLEQRFDKL